MFLRSTELSCLRRISRSALRRPLKLVGRDESVGGAGEEGELGGDEYEEDCEGFAEDVFGDALGVGAADPAAEGEADGDQKGELEVDVAGFVVGPEGEDADGQQERGNGCPLGAELGHAEEEDEGGDEECSAADTYETGDGSDDKAEDDSAEHGGGGHRVGLHANVATVMSGIFLLGLEISLVEVCLLFSAKLITMRLGVERRCRGRLVCRGG